MSEHEPVLPFKDEYFSDWCDIYGMNPLDYEALYSHNFRVARLHTKELSAGAKFRKEVEDSLPLEGATLVDDFRFEPGNPGVPKLFKAPEGQAFEITTTYEYEERDVWGYSEEDVPKKSATHTFVGEYLGIESYIHHGEGKATITVRERPSYTAFPVIEDGIGPDARPNEHFVRLPSKFDLDKDGAFVIFDRVTGWQVGCAGDKLRADYAMSKVRLVPHDPPVDNELYIADSREQPQYALDDFRYFPERPQLPPGFFILPGSEISGEPDRIIHNEVLKLVLPPIDREHWGDLWYDHGIMIKVNPTITDQRFVSLDLDRRVGIEDRIRELNRKATEGKMFMRILVVRGIGGRSMADIVKLVSSRETGPDVEDIKF